MAANDPLPPRARQILLAAAGLFIEQGFHSTTMRDVARAAGVSLGNVYNHFEAKTELIQKIALLEAEEQVAFLAQLSATDNPKATLLAFVESYLKWAAKPENVVLTAEITAEALRNPHTAEAFLQNREQLVSAVAAVVAAIDDRGRDDPRLVAALLLDMIEGSAQRVADGSRREAKRTRDVLRSAVTRMLASGDG